MNRVILLLVFGAALAQAQLVSIDAGTLPLSSADRAALAQSLQAGQWLAVEAALFRHVHEQPDSASLRKALATAHFRNERYLAAASEYGRAARREALDPGSRFTLAAAYIALDRRHWARLELQALAVEYPRNALYPHWLAGIYQHYQWFDEAVREAHQAIALNPEFSAAHDRLGECLEALGRQEEALAAYAAADHLARQTQDPSPWPSYHRGSLLRQTGRLKEALPALQRAAALDPKHAGAHHELALTLEALQRPADALAAMKTAVGLNPEQPKFHYALARLQRRAGDLAGARSSLQRFQQLSRTQASP